MTRPWIILLVVTLTLLSLIQPTVQGPIAFAACLETIAVLAPGTAAGAVAACGTAIVPHLVATCVVSYLTGTSFFEILLCVSALMSPIP